MSGELLIGPRPEHEQNTFFLADRHGHVTEEVPIEELWAHLPDAMTHESPDDQEEGEL